MNTETTNVISEPRLTYSEFLALQQTRMGESRSHVNSSGHQGSHPVVRGTEQPAHSIFSGFRSGEVPFLNLTSVANVTAVESLHP